jgi:hypothetical protein
VLHFNRFLRVENSLQKVDLWFNDAGKAISMPFSERFFAHYTPVAASLPALVVLRRDWQWGRG